MGISSIREHTGKSHCCMLAHIVLFVSLSGEHCRPLQTALLTAVEGQMPCCCKLWCKSQPGPFGVWSLCLSVSWCEGGVLPVASPG